MDEKKIIVLWFRNDLRLSDNLALVQATAEADEIIPFYCFDDRSFRHQIAGFPKTGAIRAQFLLESIADLQLACAEKNLHLQVSCGDTVKALQDLYRKYSFDSIFCGRQTCSEELHVEEQIEAAGFRLQRFWQAGLYDPDALPFKIDQLPDVYTAFRKKVEKYGVIDPVLAVPSNLMGPSDLGPCTIPTLKDLGHNKVEPDPRAAMTFIGGSAEAKKRLDYYFWEEGHVQVYKETRNGMVGPNYSSKFSPWLATGSISAKEIYWELIRFEQVILKNASTYWLYFELMWRDYFRLSALKEGACFFNMPLETTFELNSKFESWRLGETSEDFVNAHMKELLNTGFMSNRGRQNVASYLIHDLQLPWTWGAAWFESQLIDYDVCSNYGNWTYLAGVGKDPRNNRSFNIKGQAQRYDPIARFQNLWLKP